MARAFQPARLGGQDYFPATSLLVHAAESYKLGALLYINTSGELQEVATDPAAIAGVAAGPAFSGPGQGVADTAIVVTPPVTAQPGGGGSVYKSQNTVFSGQMYSGTTLVTPTAAMIESNYGVTKLADGTWTLDQTKTSAIYQRVTVVQIDTALNLVFFKIMSTYQQA